MLRSRIWNLSLPLLAGVVLAACEGEDGRPEYPHFDKTIWTLLNENGLTKFADNSKATALNTILDNTQATYTVLAPSDAAFGAATGLPTEVDELSALLRFHMLAGTIDSTLLKVGGEFHTITATTVRIETEGTTTTVFDYLHNSAKFTMTDIRASNGVLHVIDKVLTPPPAPVEPACGDGNVDDGEACDDGNTMAGDGCDAMCAIEAPGALPDVLMSEGFTSFLGAIDGTLVETEISNAAEEYTVFAPNEAAFTALGDITGVNADVLENILLSHVVEDKVTTAELVGHMPLTNLAGTALAVAADGTTVGGATIGEKKDVEASNGLVQELTSVIVPPSSLEYAAGVNRLMRTTQAATRADAMVAELKPDTLMGDMPITVFLPDNMSWSDAMIDTMLTSTSTLANILKAHATNGQLLTGDLSEGQMLTMLNGSVATVHIAVDVITLTSGGNVATVTVGESNIRTLSGAVHVVSGLLDKDDQPN